MKNLVDLGICVPLRLWSNVLAENHLIELIKVLRRCACDLDFAPSRSDGWFNSIVYPFKPRVLEECS